MKCTAQCRHSLTALLFVAFCAAPLFSQSFKKGYKYYNHRDYSAARAVFERYRHHRKYAGAAQYFLAKIRLTNTRDLPNLMALDRSLTEADSLLRRLPPRRARRQQRKFGVDTAAVLELRVEAQRWAVACTRARGTLPALDSLLTALPAPLPAVRPEVASAAADIVNAQLGSRDYDVMTAILRRHVEFVLPENYNRTRRMNDQLWPAFLEKYPPCALDRFAKDHPHTFAALDCWRDTVQTLLCSESLPDLLAFHEGNRWTALEIVLLNEIAARAEHPDSTASLPAWQQQHLQDLRSRSSLRGRLQSGAAARDTSAALQQALRYITQYAPRYSAFRLLDESLQFFLDQRCYQSAVRLLEEALPYFPDTLPAGCHSNFDYQQRVRPWINGKLPILQEPGREVARRALTPLNTPDGDESNPVVSADGLEIYFAASGRPDNDQGQDVFVARRTSTEAGWQAPVLVPGLSGPGNQAPLSLSDHDRLLLLLINGRLHTSRRNTPAAPWNAPSPLPISGIDIIGKGQLSADGNTLVLEGAYSAGSATQAPDLDIFVSTLGPKTGEWSRPGALGAAINTDAEDANPCLSPDAQTLWYTSSGYPGLGRSDIFAARRNGAGWTQWQRPKNLGKELNDTFQHRGFTTVSPNGRRAWLSVEDAEGKGDLWELEMEWKF